MSRKRRPTQHGGLRIGIEGKDIVIRLQVSGLKKFYVPVALDSHFGCEEHNCKVTHNGKFAREVVRELMRDEEDGSTLVTKMLDKAFINAIEAGAQGVEFLNERR